MVRGVAQADVRGPHAVAHGLSGRHRRAAAPARAHGVPTRALAAAFLLLLGLSVAATAQITGVLLVFALLVAPPATARVLTPRVGLGLLLSVGIALLVVWLGLALAYFYEYPVG